MFISIEQKEILYIVAAFLVAGFMILKWVLHALRGQCCMPMNVLASILFIVNILRCDN